MAYRNKEKRTELMAEIKLTGLKYNEFATAIGISNKALSDFLNGRMGTQRASDINNKVKIYLDKNDSKNNLDPITDTKEQ